MHRGKRRLGDPKCESLCACFSIASHIATVWECDMLVCNIDTERVSAEMLGLKEIQLLVCIC
eukprot:5536431-Amphidinium_carterae.2